MFTVGSTGTGGVRPSGSETEVEDEAVADDCGPDCMEDCCVVREVRHEA